MNYDENVATDFYCIVWFKNMDMSLIAFQEMTAWQ